MVADKFRLCGANTILPFDNMLHVMRVLFYRLQADGIVINEIRASADVIVGYEDLLVRQFDLPVTMFKGLPVVLDASAPDGSMRYVQNGTVMGELWRVE